WRDNYSHLALNKISRQCRQFIIPALGPSIFDHHILAFGKSGRFQAQAERAQPICIGVRRVAAYKSNAWRHPWLLCARREWPRGHRAAEQRDELAPLHSITSSARASSVGGTSKPSACAVIRLMTSSNFVGCSTGISPGFVPRRILST